jgi:streptogramin lyase
MRTWIGCIALLTACGQKHSQADDDRRMYQEMHDALVAPERRGPAFATVPEALPPAKPAASGPAYIVLKDVGIATFEVDGMVTLHRVDIGPHASVAVAPDGAVIVAGKRVFKLRGDNLETIGGDDSPQVSSISPPHIEVAPDGSIWVANGKAVHGWDGSKWTTVQATETVDDFAFDGKGRVYTVGTKQLGVIEGGAWKKMYDLEGALHEGVLADPYLGTIDVIGKQLVATHRSGILKLDGANLESIERKVMDPPLAHGRVIGDDYVSVYENKVVHTPLAGGPDKVVSIKDTVHTSIVQIDAQGRVWGSNGSGDLSVVDAEGSVTSWPAATIPEITSSIESIYVSGKGPEKLPGKRAVAKGTIRGHIVKKGTPVAKAYVEVCQYPSDRVHKDETPCGSRKHAGETDDKGAFAIADLPLLDYTIVIRDGDQWYSLLGSTCGGMQDGQTCDVGELEVTNKPFPSMP